MSCPDWFSLAEPRDEDAERWQDALIHFDSDCPRCREQALDAEPTLLFRNLPEIEIGAEDIAAMQQAVATLRRGREVEAPSEERVSRRQGRVRIGWARAAAVAALLCGATWIGLRSTPVTPPTAETSVAAIAAPTSRSMPHAASMLPGAVAAAHLPLVEDVDPAFGDLIQVEDAEISIVMVLPQTTTERLDV